MHKKPKNTFFSVQYNYVALSAWGRLKIAKQCTRTSGRYPGSVLNYGCVPLAALTVVDQVAQLQSEASHTSDFVKDKLFFDEVDHKG